MARRMPIENVAIIPVDNVEQILPAPAERVLERQRQTLAPLSFSCQRARWSNHDLVRMEIRCSGCNALHWTGEPPASRRPWDGVASFHSCCMRGKVQIEAMLRLLEPLNTLMNGDNPQAKVFRQGLRQSNSIFAFTSIWVNMDNRASEIGGTFQLFQIHGVLYHR